MKTYISVRQSPWSKTLYITVSVVGRYKDGTKGKSEKTGRFSDHHLRNGKNRIKKYRGMEWISKKMSLIDYDEFVVDLKREVVVNWNLKVQRKNALIEMFEECERAFEVQVWDDDIVVCDEVYSTDNRCKDGRMAEALAAAGV